AAGIVPRMLMKPDLGIWDAQDPSVFLTDTAAIGNSRISMITGRQHRYARTQPTIQQLDGNTVVFAMNLEIDELLTKAYADHISPQLRYVTRNGITWAISDSLRADLRRPP